MTTPYVIRVKYPEHSSLFSILDRFGLRRVSLLSAEHATDDHDRQTGIERRKITALPYIDDHIRSQPNIDRPTDDRLAGDISREPSVSRLGPAGVGGHCVNIACYYPRGS
jgi:hypothetical protein